MGNESNAIGCHICHLCEKLYEAERFISGLENRDGPLTEFNEKHWYSLVDYATVYGRDDIRFTFKNGMEVKA